jgi:hypothetical protein
MAFGPWFYSRLFQSLDRCYPLSYRPPLLYLFCTDEISSAQRTISIVSLHTKIVHGEEAMKGGKTA